MSHVNELQGDKETSEGWREGVKLVHSRRLPWQTGVLSEGSSSSSKRGGRGAACGCFGWPASNGKD